MPSIQCTISLLMLLTFCAADLFGADGATKPVSFVRDIRPLLARNCFACHGPDDKHREAELRLDTHDGVIAEHEGRRTVVPSDLAKSELVRRIISPNPSEQMPPPDSGKKLTTEQIELLKSWVEQGAPWGSHWSFEKPSRPELPAVKDASWPKTDLDRFVLARLEREGLAPSPEADRYTLVRRVAFDLTGLPPDLALVKRFVNDPSPNAFEAIVDELLKSPKFGERWARTWLDLARFADTKGYEKDLARTMWRYRDWVIEAYNRDLPFDQFTREQLAGDLLPNATTEQRLATAFHRNTMVNDEGGTDNEEFRVAAVKDRVDTTMQVWMGLTMGCAKCHSHKYDPIAQREYYQFYAYFNQTEDADDSDERPKLATPTQHQNSEKTRLLKLIADKEHRLQTYSQLPETSDEFKSFQAAERGWEESVKGQRGWVVLKPSLMSTGSGNTITLQDDGSILAEAKSPSEELYMLTLPIDLQRFSGLKLETLPDKSHPKGGVGRAVNDGNFVLSSIKVQAAKPSGEITDVELSGAQADFAQEGYPVKHAIKNPDRKKHGWAISPQQSKPHTAIFTPTSPLTLPVGTSLLVTLDHRFEFGYPGFSIGRFRLSATSDDKPNLDPSVPESILAIIRIPEAERSSGQRLQLYKHYAAIAPITKPLRDEIAALQKEMAALPIPQTPVMRELPDDKRRVTKVHTRGDFLSPGEIVEAAIPASFHPFPAGSPANRLGVADWLTHPDNPLTARVAVNRVWAQFFGTGLVHTQEDFGSQGQPPSHPELLDWLAVEFMGSAEKSPWSHKRLCKLIVMSATYRQSSRASSKLLERDRFNVLLARGPRFRLEAEMIRDNALAVSGLLSHKMYGPSVMPPQPEGIWQSTYNTTKWETSKGEDRYRRGLYTFIKRTTPYPAMTTLDAPSRELCTIRRITTNTPLQALVTLNDPAYIEAAQALARRMVQQTSSGRREDLLANGIELALSRPAEPNEIAALMKLFESRHAYYATHLDEALRFATDPLGPLPEGRDAADMAALTAIGNVILNLDEFVTRN